MDTIVETKNISVDYGKSEVLTDISVALEAGDYIGLAGPNGAGKTTFIKAILGLVPLSRGAIILFGKPQAKFTEWGKIGYLPQKTSAVNSIFPVTVEEAVMTGIVAQKTWPKRMTKADSSQVLEVLEHLEIADLKQRLLSELSGGQQQKVLLARALASRPKLLIFDEPSTALDPESRETFFQLIQNLNKKDGIPDILITHDTGYIGKYANKLLYLDRKLIFFGSFSDYCKSSEMSRYFGDREQHIICHQHN